MRVEIPIYEDNIKSAVRFLIMEGKRPTLANVRSIIKEMIIKYGEVWTTEPTFDDCIEIVDFDTAGKIAIPIAEKLYSKIY
jgi:hypothetical protein